jgi:hypothetical protein
LSDSKLWSISKLLQERKDGTMGVVGKGTSKPLAIIYLASSVSCEAAVASNDPLPISRYFA